MGHRSFECPKRSGNPFNNGGAAKLGNFRPTVCHGCGESGHIRPNCPKRANANVTASSHNAAKNSAPDASKQTDESKFMGMDAFANMCSEMTSTADMYKGVIGPQFTAPIFVNGVEVKALFDLGSQVNIISRDCLREVLRKGNVPCDKLQHGIMGHPPGVNMTNASGTPMKFFGLGHCVIQTDPNDPGEEHPFLVQENANYDVVLGTPLLLGNSKWRERVGKLLTDWDDKCARAIRTV